MDQFKTVGTDITSGVADRHCIINNARMQNPDAAESGNESITYFK
ncbi:MAG: hypothetical protein ACRECG_02955 [Bradyrhizobium sp.]